MKTSLNSVQFLTLSYRVPPRAFTFPPPRIELVIFNTTLKLASIFLSAFSVAFVPLLSKPQK